MLRFVVVHGCLELSQRFLDHSFQLFVATECEVAFVRAVRLTQFSENSANSFGVVTPLVARVLLLAKLCGLRLCRRLRP